MHFIIYLQMISRLPVSSRLAETPECWSLELQLDMTFADNVVISCKKVDNFII